MKNAASTLGLGWLGALLVLSGSPIAASRLLAFTAGLFVVPLALIGIAGVAS